jgi:hypothetical protein
MDCVPTQCQDTVQCSQLEAVDERTWRTQRQRCLKRREFHTEAKRFAPSKLSCPVLEAAREELSSDHFKMPTFTVLISHGLMVTSSSMELERGCGTEVTKANRKSPKANHDQVIGLGLTIIFGTANRQADDMVKCLIFALQCQKP